MLETLLEPVFAPCADRLSMVDSPFLDCVSNTLALVLAQRGVADVRTPFACDWRFDLAGDGTGPHGLDLPPGDQDDLLARRTGWRPTWRPIRSVDDELAGWQGLLAAGSPVVLVGDAFHLPWLPYVGHEHMDHGFVLEGILPGGPGGDVTVHLVDPYENVTQWGRAVPTCPRVPLRSLVPALTAGRWGVLAPAAPDPAAPDPAAPDPAAVLAANAEAIRAAADRGHYRRFVEQYRPMGTAELEHLALQTWLLTRNRGLHRRWLAALPERALAPRLRDRFAAEIETGWQRAGEIAYLALRRVRSGRAAPTSALTALQSVADAETAFAADLIAAGGGTSC